MQNGAYAAGVLITFGAGQTILLDGLTTIAVLAGNIDIV